MSETSSTERAKSDFSIHNDTNNTNNSNVQLQDSDNNIALSYLQHRYWVVRHGQSEANVQKIISSHPDISTKRHGVSSVGKEEAKRAGKVLATELLLVPSNTTTTTYTTTTFSGTYARIHRKRQIANLPPHTFYDSIILS